MRYSSLAIAVVLAIAAGVLLIPHGQAQEDALLAKLQADITASSAVVVGVVRGSKPIRGSNDYITTTHTIQKTRVLKGAHAAGYVTITIPGGTVGDLSMSVSYLPRLNPGNKVLLLLDASGNLRPGQTVYRLTDADNLEQTSVSLTTIQGLIP